MLVLSILHAFLQKEIKDSFAKLVRKKHKKGSNFKVKKIMFFNLDEDELILLCGICR